MLIASRCKKDMTPECPEEKVKDRMAYGPVGTTFNETSMAPELNPICDQCTEWEPIHDKPESRILYACDVVDTSVCPHPEVSPNFVRSEDDIASFDDLCRPCRLYHPRIKAS